METGNRLMFPEDRIAKNPSVDLKLVKEAERARKELESLGVWEKTGSRVRNPSEIKPDLRHHRQRIAQLIEQSR